MFGNSNIPKIRCFKKNYAKIVICFPHDTSFTNLMLKAEHWFIMNSGQSTLEFRTIDTNEVRSVPALAG